MSESTHRPTTTATRRRWSAALVATALAVTGSVASGGSAAASGPLVIDDFVAPTPAHRSVELNRTTLTETSTGTRVDIGSGGGSNYAWFTWTFATPIDLTRGGSLTQMQLDYSGATGTDSAGNPLSNPIMMGMSVHDSSGGMRSRGGTGVIAGSGKFVTNFSQQGADDVRYLQGDGDLTSVSSVRLFVGTIGNFDTASVTVEWLAAVATESAYTMPEFSGPTALDVETGSPVSAAVTVTGYPRPTVSTSGALPPGVTATTSGTTVTLSGAPTTAGTWDFTVHGYTLDWLDGSHTVRIRSFVAPTLTGTSILQPEVGVPFTSTLTVGGEPLPTTATFSPALPPGLTGTISGTTLTIAGTATGPGGPAPTTATVDNGYASASLALDVTVVAPPTLSTLDDVFTTVGAAITPISITAAGYPVPAVAVSGLPAGLFATATTGGTQVTGTPTAVGTSTVTVTATNGVGAGGSADFSLVVGTEPTLGVVAATPVTIGAGVHVPIAVTGYPAPVVTADGLPAGLTMSEDVDGWALRGIPTGPGGPSTVSLTASNGVGADATATVVVTVVGPPAINGPATLDLPVGVPLPADVTFTGSGYPVPVMTVAGDPPPGLTLDSDDGELTLVGTPTETGVWALTVVATNTEGAASHDVVVTVGRAPVFAEESVTVGVRANHMLDTDLAATSWPGHTVTITAGTLPSGMTLTPEGRLSGTSGSAAAGRYELTVQATNAYGSDTLSLTIDVLTPPDIPAGLPALTATAGTAVTYTFVTSGWDPPTVTALDPLPDGLTLTQSADLRTWQIAGTPTRDGRGIRTVRLELTNEYGVAVTKSLSVTVYAPLMWDQPSGRTIVVERGAPIDPVRISVGGYPLVGGLISWGNTGLSFTRDTWTSTGITGWITGTPTGSGVYSICVGSPPQNCVSPVLVTWFTVQDRPVITAPSSTTVAAGESVSIPITVTGEPAATLTATDLPAGLTMNSTGTGTWTISGGTDRTMLGEHTITLTADNGLTRVATVVLTITGSPEVPGPVTVTAPVGVPLSGTVIATTGYPLPTFDVVAGTLPPGVSMHEDGSGGLALSGTPTTLGSWTVAITATNTVGAAATSLTVDVVQAPEFDSDGPVELTLREGDPFSYTPLTTAYPAPTWTVTGPLPTGMTFSGGSLTGTPAAGSADAGSGRFEIVLEASNAHGSDTLAISLVVLSPPGFPAGLPTMSIDANTAATYTFTTGGWDRPTVTLLDSLPDGLSLAQVDETTWQITGTVARELRGPHTVRVALDNAFGRVVQTLQIDVHAPLVWGPAPTSIVVETGVPITPLTLTASGYPMPTNYGVPERPSWIHWPWYSYGETDFAIRLEGTPTTAGPARLTLRPLGVPGPAITVTFLVTDRPEITAPASQTVLTGTAVDIPVSVSGSPAASVTATGLPTGLTIGAGAAPGEWHITGTLGRDTFGTYDVTLTADNGLVSTHDLTVTVAGVPTLDDATVTTYLDAATDAVVRSTGSPLPTLAVTAGSLPPGLTATDDGSGGLAFTGTPTAPGSWDVTVTATNSHGSDSAIVVVEVRATPDFADALIEHTLREGDPVDFTARATGYPAPTVDIASGVLPDGLSLSSSGRITGTPTAGSADAGSGRYELVLRARSTEGEDAVPVTLVVLSPPSFPAGLPTMAIDAGAAAAYTFTTGGWDRPTVTALDPLPDGLGLAQVDETTWQITGTAARDLLGPHEVRVQLDNAFGVPTVQTLRIEVHAPLVWDPAPETIVVETGVPIDPLHLSATGYPMPGSLTLDPPSWIQFSLITRTETSFAVTLSGTPTSTGPAELTLRPNGADGPDITVTFLVTDRPVVTAPTEAVVVVGVAVDLPIVVAGSPTAALTSTDLPDGLELAVGGEPGLWRITGTPTRAHLGDHPVSLTADNGLTTVHDLALTVEAPPDIPAIPTEIEIRAGGTLSVRLPVSGLPTPTIEVLGDVPAGLVVNLDEPGVLRVEGTAGEPGTGEVTIRATNAHGVAETTVTYLISEPAGFERAAVGVVLVEGVAARIDLPMVGFPTPTVEITGSVPGMSLLHVPGSNPALVGTPGPGSAGDHTVTLTARNTVLGVAQEDVAAVRARVVAPPEPSAPTGSPGTGSPGTGSPGTAAGGRTNPVTPADDAAPGGVADDDPDGREGDDPDGREGDDSDGREGDDSDGREDDDSDDDQDGSRADDPGNAIDNRFGPWLLAILGLAMLVIGSAFALRSRRDR